MNDFQNDTIVHFIRYAAAIVGIGVVATMGAGREIEKVRTCDVNDDGIQDVVIEQNNGSYQFYLGQPDGSYKSTDDLADEISKAWEQKIEDMESLYSKGTEK